MVDADGLIAMCRIYGAYNQCHVRKMENKLRLESKPLPRWKSYAMTCVANEQTARHMSPQNNNNTRRTAILFRYKSG